MTPFQEELYRLIQDCKQQNNAFTSAHEDAGNEVTRLVKFSNEWDFKDKFENVNKANEQLTNRLSQEKSEAEARTVKNITRELIPIIDDLFLLLKVASDSAAISKTVKMLIINFETYLRRHNGGFIRPKIGEAFNPTKHKAVSVVGVAVHTGNTVEEIYRIGYFVENQVLREAEVKVKCAVSSALST